MKAALQKLTLRAKPKKHLATLHIPELGLFPATIGKAGLRADKKEGDMATPVGAFALPSAFGLGPKPKTRMPYRQITPNTLCIDDLASCHYNTLIEKNRVMCDWTSCEQMAAFDLEYRYGVVIDSPQGSCLFIHIWKSPTTPTAGCIALSQQNLLKILAWLDPKKRPTLTVCFEN